MKMFLLGMLIMYIIGWLCWKYEDFLEDNGHYTPLPNILYSLPIFFLTIILSPIVFIYLKIKKCKRRLKNEK